MNEYDENDSNEYNNQNSNYEENKPNEEEFIPRDELEDLNEKANELGYYKPRDEEFYNRNKESKDYSFKTKKSNKPLFNNGVKKECSKCHEIKPYTEFSDRNDLKTKKKIKRSRCKKCRVTDFAIRDYKNKIKVATNIYQGIFKGKCSKCQIDIKKLPVLEFHHIEPKSKTISWKNVPKKNWKETMEILEKENVELLCRNCHTKEGSKNFNKYKRIILKKDIFDFPGLVIDKMVHKYVYDNRKVYNKKDKFLALEWIKKRRIVEDLYNGKCVGCKKINTLNNLPSLEFHHPNHIDIDKKLRWKNIRKNNLENIAELLIKEECICLCSNCHKLVHSNQFEGNLSQIFEKAISQEINEEYRRIKTNIEEFTVNNIKSRNPLEKIYGYGENWKKFLLNIYALSAIRKKELIGETELINKIGITKGNIKKNLKNLEEMDLIELNKRKEKSVIKLKQKGYKELDFILPFLVKYKNILKKIPENILDREIKNLISISKTLDVLANNNKGY